jgi:hypothetical protein
MIKSNQHMFPIKYLVKIDDLCEKSENKSAVIAKFHRWKINMEDPFTQTEFSGKFSIKTHHFLQKKIQKQFVTCVLETFLPTLDLSIFSRSRQFRFMKASKQKSFLGSERINLKI